MQFAAGFLLGMIASAAVLAGFVLWVKDRYAVYKYRSKPVD